MTVPPLWGPFPAASFPSSPIFLWQDWYNGLGGGFAHVSLSLCQGEQSEDALKFFLSCWVWPGPDTCRIEFLLIVLTPSKPWTLHFNSFLCQIQAIFTLFLSPTTLIHSSHLRPCLRHCCVSVPIILNSVLWYACFSYFHTKSHSAGKFLKLKVSALPSLFSHSMKSMAVTLPCFFEIQ